MTEEGAATEQYKFIVIEGIDGSGKTTVGKRLARAIKGHFIATPPAGCTQLRRRIENRVSVNTRFLFYLFAVSYASDKIRELRKRTHVVCDRYVASTVCYHRAMGLQVNWDVQQLGLSEPDLAVRLTVRDDQERKRRVDSRPQKSAADGLVDDECFRGTLEQQYAHWRCVEIDTSNKTVDEVVTEIKRLVNA